MSDNKKQDLVVREEQRLRVKELYLKSISPRIIAKTLQLSLRLVNSDITYWEQYYSQLALNNPQFAGKQYAQVQQLVEEVALIKKEYWEIYDKIKKREILGENKYLRDQKEIEKFKKEIPEQEKAGNTQIAKQYKTELARLKKQKNPAYHNTKLDALGAILTRIEKESKLLTLFNPATILQTDYIPRATLMQILHIFKAIIQDLIVPAKQKEAFKRMRELDLTQYTDASFTEK